MKSILIFLPVFLLAAVTTSQPLEFSGIAKITIKAFWEGAAKLEKSIEKGGSSLDADMLSGLQRKIDDVKRKDPGYNTASMDAKIKSLSEGIKGNKKNNETATQANSDRVKNIINVDKLLYSLFHISIQVDRRQLETIQETLAKYKTRTAELLAMDRSNSKNELGKYSRELKGNFKYAEEDIYGLGRRCLAQTDPQNAEVDYYALLYNQAFWDAAQQVYPEEADFKTAYNAATKTITGLGSIADLHANAKKIAYQKIKDTKLPDAVLKNAAYEKMFIDVLNKENIGIGIKAALLSKDWRVKRNEISSVIIGRWLDGAVTYKGKDGKCYLAKFEVFQDYIGSSFQGTRIGYIYYTGAEMLCENTK